MKMKIRIKIPKYTHKTCVDNKVATVVYSFQQMFKISQNRDTTFLF